MTSRGLLLLSAIGIAVIIGVAPFVLGHWVLMTHAERIGRDEISAVAARQLERSEVVVAEAISVLREADRAGLSTCRAEDLALLGEKAARSQYIRRIGIVDATGLPMCFDPPPARRRGAALFRPDPARAVTLAVLDPEVVPDAAKGTVVVAWRTAVGVHLIAEIAPSMLDLDGGAAYLRGSRSVTVELGGGVWAAWGGRTDQGEAMVAEARSDYFPLAVRVEVSRSGVMELVRPLEATLAIGSIASTVVLIGFSLWLFRKPTSEVDDEIAVALGRAEFEPYFQPVMNIDTGRIEGCEMLARWIRPDGTTVSPGAFMPYVESSGHVFEMTRQLMRKSLAALGTFYAANPELKLSINLFAGHFDDHQIIEDIEAIFGDGPIAYDQLVFEVTERYPLRDVPQARRIIAEMHTLGCRVALDDTGTGHGGLAYIQQLGIDIVKIDKMFVDAMGADLGASTIVDVLVELANSLDMGVVAEGVETQEQLERLRAKGVTSAQGYVFAPALPADLFVDLAASMVRPHLEFDDDDPADQEDAA